MTQREQQNLQLIQQDPMISQQDLADALGITRSSVAVHISNLMQKGLIAGRGYVLRSGSYVVVVGGTNMDIAGRSTASIVAEDSNPGVVTMTLGGVGRNIAQNLSQLDVDVRMLTTYGDDANGRFFRAACAEQGIDIRNALMVPGGTTCTYLYVAHPDGEMMVAVSDMVLCDQITPEYLAENLSLLQNARLVVADTNIPPESLAYLAENCTVPLFVDPVSTAKAPKLLPILDKIHTLKPNRLEAEILSGVAIRTNADVEEAARVLLEKGVQRVVISLGANGVYAASQEEALWHSNLPGQMVNTTGCGDAFMAALVWGWLEDLTLEEVTVAGLAAGAMAMESVKTINPDLSAESLRARMNVK